MSHIHRFLPACGAKAGLPLVLLAGLGLSAVPPGPGEAEFRLPNPLSAIPSDLHPADGNLEALKAQANAAAMKGDAQEYERIIGAYRQLKGTLIPPHSRSHSTHGSLVNTATSAHQAQWSATVSTGSVSETLNASATSGSSSVSATPSALTMTGSLTATGTSVANGSTLGAFSLEQELENLTTGEVSYLPGPAGAASSSSAASLPANPGRPLLTSAGNQALPLLPDFAEDHLTAFTPPAQVASAPEADRSGEAFAGPCELAHAQALADLWNLRVDIFERVPDAQDVNGQTAIRSLHQLNPEKRPNDSRFRLLCQDGQYSLVREARAGEVAQYVLSGTGYVHPEAFPLAGQPVFQPVPADENSFIAALFCAVQGDFPNPGEIASIRQDITRKMQTPAANVSASGSSLAAAQ